VTGLLERWDAAVLPTYATPPLALARGRGATVQDTDGRAYLDLLGGIAVSVVGHCHPDVVSAVTRQAATLMHVSNLYATEPAVALAERLVALLGGAGRVFFTNSGAEANEAAFKIARRYGGPRRTEVIAAAGSFHGRTMGALALTGQPAKRAPFEPLPGPVTFVPYGDAAALAAAVTERTAAVVLEPLLGEGGVLPPPRGYLAAARDVTARAGALLVLDEVQTGVGRTGAWFAHQHERVRPDVVTLAKGLGGGLPIGACVALGAASDVLGRGEHGSTFGGNPVCAAAALAVLDVIERDGLLQRAGTLGGILRGTGAIPGVAAVRGAGALLGIVLDQPVATAAEPAARQQGFLLGTTGPGVLRLAPPLVLTDDEARSFLDAFPGILAAATEAANVGA
jgi:acetylornithine aminotransferase